MEADFGGFGSRRDVMRAAKSGKEVVECHFVRQIDHRESETDLVSLRLEVKHVIVAQTEVKQITGRDARRIVIVILRSGSRYFHERRTELRRSTGGIGTDRCSRSGVHAAAK